MCLWPMGMGMIYVPNEWKTVGRVRWIINYVCHGYRYGIDFWPSELINTRWIDSRNCWLTIDLWKDIVDNDGSFLS